jgi:hypothetical protein
VANTLAYNSVVISTAIFCNVGPKTIEAFIFDFFQKLIIFLVVNVFLSLPLMEWKNKLERSLLAIFFQANKV